MMQPVPGVAGAVSARVRSRLSRIRSVLSSRKSITGPVGDRGDDDALTVRHLSARSAAIRPDRQLSAAVTAARQPLEDAQPAPPPGDKAARRRRDRAPLAPVLVACAVLLIVTVTLGVCVGSVRLNPAAVSHVIAGGLAGHAENKGGGIVVWRSLVPRVCIAALGGTA